MFELRAAETALGVPPLLCMNLMLVSLRHVTGSMAATAEGQTITVRLRVIKLRVKFFLRVKNALNGTMISLEQVTGPGTATGEGPAAGVGLPKVPRGVRGSAGAFTHPSLYLSPHSSVSSWLRRWVLTLMVKVRHLSNPRWLRKV